MKTVLDGFEQISYGGEKLSLRKSDRLFGLRSTHGSAYLPPRYERATELPYGAGIIGGFKICESGPQEAGRALDDARKDRHVAVGTHVYHSGADSTPIVPTGRIFLRFTPQTRRATRQRVLDSSGLMAVGVSGENGLLVQVSPLSVNPVRTCQRILTSRLSRNVAWAEPEFASLLDFAAITPDPFVSEQWHLKNTGMKFERTDNLKVGADAGVVDAWNALNSIGSPNITVAVIDNGFDLNHPDLAGSAKIVHPLDLEDGDTEPLLDPAMSQWHGTWCAGLAVAALNGLGVAGVAPGCRLMPIRLPSTWTNSSIIKAFDHARVNGADVVSCSWKYLSHVFFLASDIAEAISKCASEGRGGKGCVICFAAGNDAKDLDSTGYFNGFANHPDVIAVSAINSKDEFAKDYSNFGANVLVCAPGGGAGGWGILTTDPSGTYQSGMGQQDMGNAAGAYYHEFFGTSAACPIVAGVAALMLSKSPGLTSKAVADIIRNTARPVGNGSPTSHSPQYGYGCVNALSALRAL